MRRLTVVGVALAIVTIGGASLGSAQSTPKYGSCKPTGTFGSIKLPKTERANTLSVGFVALGPRTYRGNTPGKVNAGFEYCMHANIAWRAGLENIRLVRVDFAQLVVGRLKGFDVASDNIYIKPEREAKVDFSIPYGDSYTGILARTDKPPTKATLKDLVFGVTLGSVQQRYLDEVLKPTQQYRTFDDPPTAFAALRAGQLDAVMLDLPVVLPAAAASNGQMKVYAQVEVGGIVGIVMPQGTPNRQAINKMVRQMRANGTLKALERQYYFRAYGGVDPDKLPDWG